MTKKKKAEEIEQEIETPEENSSIEEETLNPVNQMEDEALEDIEENLASDEDEETETDEDESEDDEDESEDDEDEDKEMTNEEARDYVDEQIDDKFVSDCSKEKMTPEKAAKKIKELKEENEKYMTRIEVISPIAKLSNLDLLRDLVKESTVNAVNSIEADCDVKEKAKQAKEGIKQLENISGVERLISKLKYELSSKKSSLENNKRRIKEIESQGFQLGMFDGDAENTEETEVKEEIVEQPTLADEVEEVEEEPAEI